MLPGSVVVVVVEDVITVVEVEAVVVVVGGLVVVGVEVVDVLEVLVEIVEVVDVVVVLGVDVVVVEEVLVVDEVVVVVLDPTATTAYTASPSTDWTICASGFVPRSIMSCPLPDPSAVIPVNIGCTLVIGTLKRVL